jgi:hypothetical protein
MTKLGIDSVAKPPMLISRSIGTENTRRQGQQQSEELGYNEQFNGDRQAGHNDTQNGFLGQVGLPQIALDQMAQPGEISYQDVAIQPQVLANGLNVLLAGALPADHIGNVARQKIDH